jgi:peptide/nickel transport system ATP-binding protein
MSHPPTGCAFAARCSHVSAACQVQPSMEDRDGHAVACWHPLNLVSA